MLFRVTHLVVGGRRVGGVYIDEAFGADDLIALGDQDHLKAAVLPPVVERLVLAEHIHRGREAVGHRAVLAEDGDGGEGGAISESVISNDFQSFGEGRRRKIIAIIENIFLLYRYWHCNLA